MYVSMYAVCMYVFNLFFYIFYILISFNLLLTIGVIRSFCKIFEPCTL